MKTRINGEAGQLDCQTSTYAKKTVSFPSDTIKDWYPLEVNYEYKFNPISNRLYLAPLEAKQGSWIYGITSTHGRVNSKVASFDMDTWYCKEVAEDNQRVFKTASQIGLKTLEDDYTLKDVKENYKLMKTLIDTYIKPVIIHRMEKEASTEEIIAYRKMKYEDKDEFLYLFSTEYEKEKLALLGKCYIMTNFMRKRVS